MNAFKPLSAVLAAGLSCAAAPAFALETCQTTDFVGSGTNRYAIRQQARKKGGAIERITGIFLPAAASYISDVNLRTNFKTTMTMREEQTRLWTMTLTPNGPKYESAPTKYSFIFYLGQKRPNEASLPKWSRNVDDKSLSTCTFHHDGNEEIFMNGASYRMVCDMAITDEIKKKMTDLQFLEVRGRNLKKNEILRAQYSIRYPQAVKAKMAETGQAMDTAVMNGTCAPLEK